MDALVLFVSSGLLLYWVARVLLLFKGPQARVDAVLENDLWVGWRVVVTVRSLFFPAVADL